MKPEPLKDKWKFEQKIAIRNDESCTQDEFTMFIEDVKSAVEWLKGRVDECHICGDDCGLNGAGAVTIRYNDVIKLINTAFSDVMESK